MSLTSYAHHFEDVLLWRALRHVAHGHYIDVGAGDPLRGSATQAFYERGWQGINLEPAPSLLRQLRIARPADVNLGVAAAAASGEQPFFELPGTLLSTFDAARADAYGAAGHDVVRRSASLQTLDQVCAQHAGPVIHFLKIAAGGAEAEVLAGLDLQRWRPWIVVLRAAGSDALAQLRDARYALAYADGVNQYYVADEQAALATALALPPHPDDGFVLSEDHHYAWPLDEWRQRTAAAEAEAQESRTWAQAHVREWRQKYDKLEAQERRADRAEAELAQFRARATAAEAQLPGLRARAEQATVAEALVEGMVVSLSWRITRPLRDGKLKLARLRVWLRAFPGRAKRAVLRRIKGLGGVALRYVNARPKLSFFLRRTISRLPFLVPAMRALKLRLQLNNTHGDAGLPPPSADLSALPDAARQVFDDLRRARRQTPHS